MGNIAQPQSIGWLFSILKRSASKAKKGKSTQVVQAKTTSVEHKNNNAHLAKTNTESQANNNANPCKDCNSRTHNSISFALGTEFLSHQDAQIHPLLTETLSRSYVSNLYQYDQSIFGARWTTPFSSKIVQCSRYNPQ